MPLTPVNQELQLTRNQVNDLAAHTENVSAMISQLWVTLIGSREFDFYSIVVDKNMQFKISEI